VRYSLKGRIDLVFCPKLCHRRLALLLIPEVSAIAGAALGAGILDIKTV